MTKLTTKIADKDVARAFDVIHSEFVSLESLNEELNEDLLHMGEERNKLIWENNELKSKVKRLEEALVEAHLTGGG